MIICTGRRNGKTQEMLKQAMKENELLGEALKNARREIAKLKRENASLKADKKEMANRDIQIAEEYGKLIKRFQQQQKVEKFNIVLDGGFLSWQTKNYISEDLVEKAREAIKDAAFTHHFDIGEYVGELVEARQIVNLCDVLRIIDKMIEGEVEK